MIKNLIHSVKYGAPIIIVSGLPRSGTSMMMKMLEAGGLKVVTDGEREADVDNPKGYYELEKVKDIDKGGDNSWLGEHRGKVVKIISSLLKHLPLDFRYKVIFMRRDLDEVLASQNKMLVHRGENEGPAAQTEDNKMAENYTGHLQVVDNLMQNLENFDVLYVDYKKALDDPGATAKEITKFLGLRLDLEKMKTVGDKKLYRNRKDEIAKS